MSRPYHLPYKASNPRSVRGAKKRGWTVVGARNGVTRDLSWFALTIWCDANTSGYWVSSFGLREFAFENGKDATMFKLTWG